MTNPRLVLALVLIASLGLINVWYWWPATTAAPVSNAGRGLAQEFRLGDFEIKTLQPGANTAMKRDLFYPKYVPPPPKPVFTPPPGPPPKTPEELAREAAQAELAQFKCIGILFREGKGQAYLVKGDQVFLAQLGEKVGNRFIVDKISPESVVLWDPQTKVSAEVPVSGK
jgi:hypothetical protein